MNAVLTVRVQRRGATVAVTTYVLQGKTDASPGRVLAVSSSPSSLPGA